MGEFEIAVVVLHIAHLVPRITLLLHIRNGCDSTTATRWTNHQFITFLVAAGALLRQRAFLFL